jgi:hypothetical protein
MLTQDLEPKEASAQVMRVIATARLGIRPAPQEIESAFCALRTLRGICSSARLPDLHLDLARSVLALLSNGHLPAKETCIDAIRDLSMLADPAWRRQGEKFLSEAA